MIPHLRANALRIIPIRLACAVLAVGIVASAPVPTFAQDSTAEARIRKLEGEIRALQRKVFPGGDGRFFEPQIAPGTAVPAVSASTVNASSPTAVTDILVRLDTLEAQLQSLTARSEEQTNGLAQLEARLLALETVANAPIASVPMASTVTGPAVQATGRPAVTRPTTTTSQVATTSQASTTSPATTAMATPSAARLAAVQAIAKPQTADAADDEYSYGFRLWNAGLFPEARQQLTKYVDQNPNHSRISFGRNLLGRAFLDDNMPDEAARWFLKNYQSNKAGDRAPDSLLYLGASMIALQDTKRACIALAEFADTYPLVASGRLASEYQANRAKVTCS